MTRENIVKVIEILVFLKTIVVTINAVYNESNNLL